MDTRRSSSRISKIRILPAKVQKQQFHMPLSNRYFSKISIQKPIMGLSMDLSRGKTDVSGKNGRVIGRSLSMHVSRKESIIKDRIQNTVVKDDLPQIKTKRQKHKNKVLIEPREIISSEVGALSFNVILGLKQKIEDGFEEISKKSTIKANSVVSEDYSVEDQQQQNKANTKITDQKPYEDYDKLLMMKEPVIYMRKRFNLKHKAQWVIPS